MMRTSGRGNELAAEQLLLQYVRDHPNDPADAAVNWATLQRYSVTVPIARAAMWHLVAYGQLRYSWDGLLTLPGQRTAEDKFIDSIEGSWSDA